MVCRTAVLRASIVVVACVIATLPGGCAPASSNGDDAGAADGGGEGEGEGEEAQAFCRAECATAADCVVENALPHIDEDNYECRAGACEYLGCLAEAECDALGATPEVWTCYRREGFAFSLCVSECEQASDCASPGATGAQDADNYECDQGACWDIGCHDDDECEVSLGEGARCVGPEGAASCAKPCEEAADCVVSGATPAFDEDNYACREGVCRYLGCLDDDECTALTADHVCR